MATQPKENGSRSRNTWTRGSRPLCAFSAALGAILSASTAVALTPVELTRKLEQYANDISGKIKALEASALQTADEKCDSSLQFPSAEKEDLTKCKATIASGWHGIAKQAIEDTLASQEDALKKTRESDGAALAGLNDSLRKRREAINTSLGSAADESASKLEKKNTGTLNSWLDDEKTVAGLAEALAGAAKSAAHTADKGVIEAFVPKTPADADLIEELAKTRDRLLAASEKAYQRRVNCSWNSAGDTLTCSPGLLLSGEEPSDVLVEGLPAGTKFTVTALLTEEEVVGAQEIERSAKMSTLKSEFGTAVTQRLDVDQVCFEGSEALPVVIEVHTDRKFRPTHGGRSHAFTRGKAKYWARTAARLRSDGSDSDGCNDPRKLTLISKGTAPRLHIAIAIAGVPKTAVASIPLEFARWKFETGGFLGVSSVVDQEVRTRPDPANSARVIVEDIRDVDEYSMETGVLLNFVPQNYQAVGVALGFATNEGRAPSVYLGANLRVRTFGQQGLASLGGGYLLKSVTRFPGLEKALGQDRGIAADSSLLQGDDRFEGGWAVILNLGFSFGPIGGGAGDSK